MKKKIKIIRNYSLVGRIQNLATTKLINKNDDEIF